MFGILAAAAAAHAQATPPRPYVNLRQLPEAWENALPADFNGDGKTDLIARRNPTAGVTGVAVWLGNGDGTFGTSIGIGRDAWVLATGRFNGDLFYDAVVQDVSTHQLLLLPGRGNGTFRAAMPIDTFDQKAAFVLAHDFNGDGKRDVIVGVGPDIFVYPGNNDGTFGARVTLPQPANGPGVAIAEDFNGDGKRDFAIAQEFETLSVYLNRGGMTFEVVQNTHLAFEENHGITAADLNGDGKLDLVATHSTQRFVDYSEGGIEVLLGHGDGTFAAPVHYSPGVQGAWTVVAGDFNGDGVTDLASGNRSFVYVDVGPTRHYWDSVAILPGRGDGTFGAPAVFRLDTNVAAGPDGNSLYVDSHNALKTSDVNGDGRTDLITSPGAVLLNLPLAANRLPTADAGPDFTVNSSDHTELLSVAITEADFDWLDVEWRRDRDGFVVARVPSFSYTTFQTEALTVTVRDQRGGVAQDHITVRVADSTNTPPTVTVTYPQADNDVGTDFPVPLRWDASDDNGIARFDLFVAQNDGPFSAIPECTNLPGTARTCDWDAPKVNAGGFVIEVVATDTGGLQGEGRSGRFNLETTRAPLPAPWVCGDVGAVATPGVCRGIHGEDFEQIEVEGSGADIWGSADEFTAARQDASGDFSFTVLVNRVENVNQWTKVGIMIRDWSGGSAGARHASLFVTPTTVKGIAFQRRPTAGGASVSTAGPAITAPVWLRLVRSGDVISAYYRRFTTFADNPNQGWTLLGRQQFSGLPARLTAMLVSSSHVDGTLATGNFEGARLDATEVMQSIDIGATTAGHTATDGTTVTLEGGGADIWGTADAFRFHYTPWSGDGEIIARVRSVENTNAWAKAGVMIRETLTAGSKQAMVIVSASKGIAMQYRAATGGASVEAARAGGTAPKWLRLQRVGNVISAYLSDGELGTDSHYLAWEPLWEVTVSMTADVFLGLAVTSHAPGTLASAVFDDIIVQR